MTKMKTCPECKVTWEPDSDTFGCWNCGYVAPTTTRTEWVVQWRPQGAESNEWESFLAVGSQEEAILTVKDSRNGAKATKSGNEYQAIRREIREFKVE